MDDFEDGWFGYGWVFFCFFFLNSSGQTAWSQFRVQRSSKVQLLNADILKCTTWPGFCYDSWY